MRMGARPPGKPIETCPACLVQMKSTMNEMVICTELLGHVAQLARAHRAAAACRVVVGVGPLAEVEPARLMAAFSALSAATVASGATLAVEAAPLRMRCGECGSERDQAHPDRPCPECGQNRSVLLNADELQLKLVELAGSGFPDGLASVKE